MKTPASFFKTFFLTELLVGLYVTLRQFAAEIRGRHGVPARFRVVVGESFDEIRRADGSRSHCRFQIPEAHRKWYFHEYPFAWFGILAEAPRSSDELIYANHPRGFAPVSDDVLVPSPTPPRTPDPLSRRPPRVKASS